MSDHIQKPSLGSALRAAGLSNFPAAKQSAPPDARLLLDVLENDFGRWGPEVLVDPVFEHHLTARSELTPRAKARSAIARVVARRMSQSSTPLQWTRLRLKIRRAIELSADPGSRSPIEQG